MSLQNTSLKVLVSRHKVLKGVSLRPEFLSYDVSLLKSFDYYEILPFNEANEFDKRFLNEFYSNFIEKDKNVFFHITEVAIGDEHSFFKKKMEYLKELIEPYPYSSISFHFSTDYINNRHTLVPLPIIDETQRNNCYHNIQFLRDIGLEKVSFENISVSKPQLCGKYIENFLEFITINDVKALLDISNLFNTCANGKINVENIFKKIKQEDVEYLHIGGNFNCNGIWIDSHSHFTPSHYKVAKKKYQQTPIIYEQDFNLACPTYFNTQLSGFHYA